MGVRGEQRLLEIVEAGMQVVAAKGYYGMSVQEVADIVGITQAGLLKYVKNKSGLLTRILEHYEDMANDGGSRYLAEKKQLQDKGQADALALMPEFYRCIAQSTVDNPQLTQLYLVLRAEAINPNHPAHAYYAERGVRLRRYISSLKWKLPPEYNSEEKVALLSMAVGSAMEGLQMRWLGESGIDFLEHWKQYEEILFPFPRWEGYR